MRADGVVLPLRPPLAAAVQSDRQLLREIDDRLRKVVPGEISRSIKTESLNHGQA